VIIIYNQERHIAYGRFYSLLCVQIVLTWLIQTGAKNAMFIEQTQRGTEDEAAHDDKIVTTH